MRPPKATEDGALQAQVSFVPFVYNVTIVHLKRWALFFLFLTALFCPLGAQAAAPGRIISIIPAATEMLYALGLGDRIVADTVNCDYPPQAKNKPHIGDMNINIESVVALRPDLVVGFDIPPNTRDIARLRALHVPVLALHAATLAGVESDLLALGQATGAQARARVVVAQMQEKINKARHIAALNPLRPRVLALVGYDPLYVAGRSTFIDQIVTLAGGSNVVTERGFFPYSKEAAIAAMPEAIFCNAGDARRLEADPAWRATPAVRQHHMYSIPDNLLERPGPRLADGLLQAARLIRAISQ